MPEPPTPLDATYGHQPGPGPMPIPIPYSDTNTTYGQRRGGHFRRHWGAYVFWTLAVAGAVLVYFLWPWA